MMHVTKGAALAAAMIAASMPALAQQFPESPVTYLLHVSPGGATDIMARRLSIELEKALGQPFVVENMAGGRGAAQLAELTSADPDGYTLGAVTSTHIGAMNQTLKQYNVDSVEWIARLATEPYLVVVPGNSPIQSMADLVAQANSEPGSIIMAGFVRGSGGHLAWEIMAAAADLPSENVRWVPYDSVGDAVTATLGDHADAAVAYVDLVKTHVDTGSLRVIGIMADERATQLPDVPTLAEQGIEADTSWQQMRGIIGPKGIPEDVQNQIASAVETALQTPEMRTYFEEASLVEGFMGPVDFAAQARQEDATTKALMQDLGLAQ